MKKIIYSVLLTAFVFLSSACSTYTNASEAELTVSSQEGTIYAETAAVATTTIDASEAAEETNVSAPPVDREEMKVHFLDVGQADCTFIELPNGEVMLVDAGKKDEGDKIVTYIFEQGYDTIDYFVLTHPHADHFGGAVNIFNDFIVKNFYFFPVRDEADNVSSALDISYDYHAALVAAETADNIYAVSVGDIIIDNGKLLVEVVAPKEVDAKNMNNNSIVLKITFGDRKFLLAGDAEKQEEDNIWSNIKCDVLKVGHHGSRSSSSPNFLKKVEPSYAVISSGLFNDYGHPHDITLKNLLDRNIKIYRTDRQGTIVFSTDGTDISVNVSPVEYNPNDTPTEASEDTPKYVLNTNTMKIHHYYCLSVADISERNIAYTDDYDWAIAQGYTPCGRCKP